MDSALAISVNQRNTSRRHTGRIFIYHCNRRNLIRNNENIRGVTINKVQVKLCMFADDTTVFVDGIESLKHVLDSLKIFETYSSLHINTNKSEAACIVADRNSNVNCFGLKWVNLCQSYIKILGVSFSYCQNIIHKENFVKAENNVRTALKLWKRREKVVRTLAISKLMCLFNLLDPPESTVQYLKKLLSDYVWQGKKPKIKFTTLIAPNEMGSIRFPDIESRVKSTENTVGKMYIVIFSRSSLGNY